MMKNPDNNLNKKNSYLFIKHEIPCQLSFRPYHAIQFFRASLKNTSSLQPTMVQTESNLSERDTNIIDRTSISFRLISLLCHYFVRFVTSQNLGGEKEVIGKSKMQSVCILGCYIFISCVSPLTLYNIESFRLKLHKQVFLSYEFSGRAGGAIKKIAQGFCTRVTEGSSTSNRKI